MSEKDDDKVEVRVVVESKDSASKVILIALTCSRGAIAERVTVGTGSTMTRVARPTMTTPTAIRILRSGRDTTLTAPRQTAITTRPEASPEVTT